MKLFEVMDPCMSHPCTNGGLCVRLSPTSFKCYCNRDYTGYTCQTRESL